MREIITEIGVRPRDVTHGENTKDNEQLGATVASASSNRLDIRLVCSSLFSLHFFNLSKDASRQLKLFRIYFTYIVSEFLQTLSESNSERTRRRILLCMRIDH